MGMLSPMLVSTTLVSPSLLLLLLRPWLLRGRRERLTPRSSWVACPTLLPLLLQPPLPLWGLFLMLQSSRMLRPLPPRLATRLLLTPSLLLLVTTVSLTGVDFVLFLSGPGDQRSLLFLLKNKYKHCH